MECRGEGKGREGEVRGPGQHGERGSSIGGESWGECRCRCRFGCREERRRKLLSSSGLHLGVPYVAVEALSINFGGSEVDEVVQDQKSGLDRLCPGTSPWSGFTGGGGMGGPHFVHTQVLA